MTVAAVTCPPAIPVCAAENALGAAVEISGSIAGGVASSAADGIIGSLASAFVEAFLIVFNWATTWWLHFTVTPDAIAGTVDSGFRSTVAWVASLVMVLVILSAAIQTVWRRDGAVLADSAAGIFKAVLVVAGGWAAVAAMWTLSDRITDAIAPSPQNINVDPVLASVLSAGLGFAVLLLLLSVIGFVLAVGMAFVMMFRLASVVVLALLLPIAAAGAPGTSTRAWLPKVVGWLMALIFLRPMVAAIYRIGFEFMAGGNDGDAQVLAQLSDPSSGLAEVPGDAVAGLMTMAVGIMTLLVALVALPALLKLFTWMFGGGPGGGGGGLAAASMAANGAMLARGMRGKASMQADNLGGDLGGPPGAGGAGGSGPTLGPPPIPGFGGGATSGTGAAPSAGGASAGAGAGASTAAGGAGAGGASAGAGAAAGAAGGPIGLATAAGVMVLKQGIDKAAKFSASTAEEATE